MERKSNRLVPLRWIFFSVLLVNTMLLTVHFRVQEVRLKYRVSRLQRELRRQKDLTRELSRELLRVSQTDPNGRPLNGGIGWPPEVPE